MTEPILVKDIYSGSGSSNPSDLTNVNGTLYFRAGDPTNGFELWKSDGTEAGTVLVKDINSGSSGSSLSNLTNVNGTLYFRADDGTNGFELWSLGASNAAPTDLTLDNNTINENVAANTAVGNFSTTDPDTGDTFTYSLATGTGDTDNGAFTIVGNQLQINSSPDFETQSSYNIRVQTADAAGETVQKELTVNVNSLNESPTDLTLDNNTINENVGANTTVGTFSTTDPDTGDTFTYSLATGTGDTDNGAFTIVGNQLQINSSPDFETKSSYNIRVQTADAAGETVQKELTVNVNDLPENSPPTDLTLDNNTIDENVGANTTVGSFSTTDPEPEPEPDPTPTPEVCGEPGLGQLIFGRTGDSLFLFGPEVFGTQGDDTIIGGDGAKIITAVGGRNLIFGNKGDDLIRGGDCDDTIFGGQDNDTTYGGGGNDILVGDQGDDVIFGERGDNLMFGNQGNDILQAGEGNDTLFGGQGNDSLIGGPGDNLLSGDLGDDTLTGGGGNNIFVLREDGGENLITDFQVGADRIGLSHGLTFEVLEFTQLDEQLLLAVGGETLAVLPEVGQEQLNSPANFVTLNW